MKKLKLIVAFVDEDDNIVAKDDVQANWTVDFHKDGKMMREYKYMEGEVANVIEDQLRLDLDKGLMKRLVKEINKKCD